MKGNRQHLCFTDFRWESVPMIDYKRGDQKVSTFCNVTRQNVTPSSDGVDFDVRYFECAPQGHTTLEKHQHTHIVLVARGMGKVVIGNEIYDAKPFDIFIIPEWQPHQLINVTDEPFGFFCVVNAKRDKYQLLSEEETQELKKNKEIERLIKIPPEYFEDVE